MNSFFEQVYANIGANKKRFFGTFFLVVLISYAVLYIVDFYPEPVTETDEVEVETEVETDDDSSIVVDATDVVATPVVAAATPARDRELSVVSMPAQNDIMVLPNRIVIPDSGTDVTILNPDSVDMADLDTALLDGVIRHPQSADLDDRGNILILGHSSYLPNVFNKNFQAFNGVQDLVWGDEIFVYGDNGEVRTYRVDRVFLAKASETVIDNNWGKAKLTLVTCNSFASKDDRYIVEATLVSVS